MDKDRLRSEFHSWLSELFDSLTARYRRRWNLRIERPAAELVDAAFDRFVECCQLHLEAYQEECGVLLVVQFNYRLHGRQHGQGQIEVSLERIESADGPAQYYLVAPCRLLGSYDHHHTQPRPFGQRFQTTGGDHDGVLEDVRSRRPFYVDRSPNRAEVAFFEGLVSKMARAAEQAMNAASKLAKNAPRPCVNPACQDVRDEHKARMRRILELEGVVRKLKNALQQRDTLLRQVKNNSTSAFWQRLTSEEPGKHSSANHPARRQGDQPANGRGTHGDHSHQPGGDRRSHRRH